MTPLLLLAASIAADPSPLTIASPSVDLGERSAGLPLVHVFRLRNTGPDSLTITEVTGVCGCVRKSLGSSQVKPGETTELTVGVNLLTQPEGPNAWKLAVRYRTDAGVTDHQVVQVAARVRKDVAVEPVALMLSAEKEITGSVTVFDRRGKPLTVTAVRLGLPAVKSEIDPPTNADGRRAQRIKLTVTDACPVGQHADEICIDTDDPDYRELRIPLRVIKKAPSTGVQAIPGTTTVRFAKGQEVGSGLVRLRDADGQKVVVDRIEADHPAVTCKWAAGPGSMATVRVTIDLKEARAAGVGVVSVRLKGPTEETILIPVSWTVP